MAVVTEAGFFSEFSGSFDVFQGVVANWRGHVAARVGSTCPSSCRGSCDWSQSPTACDDELSSCSRGAVSLQSSLENCYQVINVVFVNACSFVVFVNDTVSEWVIQAREVLLQYNTEANACLDSLSPLGSNL